MLNGEPLELTPGQVLKRGQGFELLSVHYFEAPSENPDAHEIWTYTDKMSYSPGETVDIHLYTTADKCTIEIFRDGFESKTVFKESNITGGRAHTPKDSYSSGCDWPIAASWSIPIECASGGYVIRATSKNQAGEIREQHHFIAIKPRPGNKQNRLLLICATSTWIAYNEWGGCNNYWLGDPSAGDMAVSLNVARPWAKGFVWLPVGAPRITVNYKPEPGAVPRYPNQEFAFAYGFSRYYAAAGWAMYERQFVQWAEKNGYVVDVITQHDLHFNPEILDEYRCVSMIGHDEYYSWEMRDSLEQYVESGGNIARFAGNFVWQIRLEDEGKTQVCYKEKAVLEDPVMGTEQEHLMTGPWEHFKVKRPGATTLGLNGLSSGIYAKWSTFTPRASGGYTVYRPEHWVFEDTDLYYGDNFGDEAVIFGYEVDGVMYRIEHGLPIPTGEDGAPDDLEILAMGLTSVVEEDHNNEGAKLFDGTGSAELVAHTLFGDTSTESIERIRRGAGMIAVMKKGKGTIFNAGSCEWVNGLRLRDSYTEQITKNVLDKFTKDTA